MNNSPSLDPFPSYQWPSYATQSTHPTPDSWATHHCSSLYGPPAVVQYQHHQLSGHPHSDAFTSAVHQHYVAHQYHGYGYMPSPSSPTRHQEYITNVDTNLTLTPPSSEPQKPASSPTLLSPSEITTTQCMLQSGGDLVKSETLNGEVTDEGNNNGLGHISRPQPARSPYEWITKKSAAYPSSQPAPGHYASHTNICRNMTGKTRTRDKYRVVYSDHQRQELELEFREAKYITIRRKAELAQQLALSERQVKIWFQNRRAKQRKQEKKKDDAVSKKEKSFVMNDHHMHHHGPPSPITASHMNGNKSYEPYQGMIHHHSHLGHNGHVPHHSLIHSFSPPNSVSLGSIQPHPYA